MVKENKMKQTEIGLIPEDWEVRKLGELGDIKMCKRIFQSQTSDFGDIPFFKIGTFGKEPDAFITRKLFNDFKNKYSFPEKGEILISAAGTIGRIVIYNGEESYFQDSNIVWISNKEEIISNELLKYVFEGIKYDTEGSTIKRLYNNILRNTSFICPPFVEQEAIAAALSDCDAWIESLEAVIAKKRLIKQAAMQELLTPKEGWEVKKLGEVSNFKNGAAHENVVDENGEYVIVNSKFISQEGRVKKYSNAFLCPLFKDEIVMVMSDIPNGKALAKCFIIDQNDHYSLNQRICAFEAKEDFNSKFLFYKINRNDYFLSFDSGSGQTNLRRDEVLNCPISFPSLSEQRRIATVLSDMDAELEALGQKLNKARQIKQGMMQELLTGRVRLV